MAKARESPKNPLLTFHAPFQWLILIDGENQKYQNQENGEGQVIVVTAISTATTYSSTH